MSRFLASALGCALLLSFALPSFAGVPDPAQSFGDPRLGTSPKNQSVPAAQTYVYTFTLMDATPDPVENWPAAEAVLDFSNCSEPHTGIPGTLLVPADGDSDVNGEIIWSVNLTFGGSDPCAVDVVISDSVFYTIVGQGADPDGGVRSVDNTGDGAIATNDLVTFQQHFTGTLGPFAYEGDYGPLFDDAIATNDLVTFQIHFTSP